MKKFLPIITISFLIHFGVTNTESSLLERAYNKCLRKDNGLGGKRISKVKVAGLATLVMGGLVATKSAGILLEAAAHGYDAYRRKGGTDSFLQYCWKSKAMVLPILTGQKPANPSLQFVVDCFEGAAKKRC